ncbi:MAG: mechanosensitive ion channel [Thermoplasmatales archaeon]|nr:MAG: mechanosensitive ion channel [Thermoplasmatales archaeon]
MDIKEVFASISQGFTETFGLSEEYGYLIVSILIFIGFLVLGWIIYYVFERYFDRFTKKTKTKLDDEILRNVKKPIYFFVIVAGLFFAIYNILTLQQFQQYSGSLSILFIILEVFLIAFIITRVVNVFIAWYAKREEKRKMSEHILHVFKGIINVIIYIIAFFVILALLKINLSGVALGGAVTAIVIGFALQSVLVDAFSAFSIYFDKPFEIGDYIVVGDYSGTVTKIGMKSTRVQLLQGEELVLANSELTKTSIRNFKKMRKRRISFSFGVTYDTPSKKLKKIPEIIKTIINPEKLKYIDNLDRVHFTEFGDFSLNFEVVYYIKNKDYDIYRDTQQAINFAIKDAFEKEGIEMAFPTQTIFLNK